ncbi:hypothetical protein Q9S36_21385 [Microbacterium sp. ARD31]|uniref:hypothetical protein n=1 Tax=Microbacterium TaxID=33882 RepID=UPI000AB73971|nr:MULTISPECIES: hypothetical protein [Microbacterium]MDT0182733.1 hypothetical protein [Microbacterium sp. ARD31]
MTSDSKTGPTWPAFVVAALVFAMLIVTVVAYAADGRAVADAAPFLILLTIFIVVGWLLSWKRPRNPIGWLLMLIPGLFTIGTPATLLGEALLDQAPGVSAWLFWYGYDREDTWSWLPPIGLLLTQIPLRFPDGTLPTPRWRWFSWYTIATLVLASAVLSTLSVEVYPGIPNPAHLPALVENPLTIPMSFGALAIAFVGSLASLVVRYRRADAVERAQLRWMLWAVGLAVAILITSWVIPDPWPGITGIVLVSYGLIPVAIAIAVLRYRLYEIDRIISRTAAYALVTAVAVAIYAIIVTSVAWLLPDATTLGVALATLVAAAVFLPVLRVSRRLLDRRFNRAQYDAERVVDAFGERLRTVADPHTAASDLTEAVERTLEPSVVGIWTPRPTV